MLPLQERIFLYRYLSRVISAGVEPKTSLKYYLEDNILKPRHHKALERALILLNKNNNLSSSMHQAKLIPLTEYLCLEPSALPQSAMILADNLIRQNLLRRKIKTLLIYPIILFIELLIILGIAIFWLTPQMQIFFDKLNVSPPKLFALFSFLDIQLIGLIRFNNMPLLIIICALLWLVYQCLKLEKIKYYLDYLSTYLFKIGSIYRLIVLQNIFNQLSLTMPLYGEQQFDQALKSTANSVKNLAYQKALLDLSAHLSKGGSFKQFWLKKKNSRLFPMLVRRLLTLGERNKNYQTEIQILAQILTEELDHELKHFIAVFEPALIISIACLVALLALTLQSVLSQAQTAMIAG